MLCLDTYALIEIFKENDKYLNLLPEDFVITVPTLSEFYYVLLREESLTVANYWIETLKAYSRPVSFDIWKEAIEYRYEYKKEKLSFFDCIGYVFARKNGLKFVTGDKEFRNKKGVKFIK